VRADAAYYLSGMKLNLALLTLLLTLLCTSGRAQTTTDDFEDGDLLNPEWSGDTDDFAVTDGRLRLMATEAGSSTLSVPIAPESPGTQETFSLEFLVEMDFAPSARNYCTVALVNRATVGTATASGAYLRFGGETADQDALTVTFIRGGDVVTDTINGDAGALGGSPAVARIRLQSTADGGWTLAADYTGGTNFVEQGEMAMVDGNDVQPDLLQLTCFYTASRSDKFSFDDLNVRSISAADQEPPEIADAFFVSNSEIGIDFNEVVLSSGIDDIADFVSAPAGNAIVEATVSPSGRRVVLRYAEPFPPRQELTVRVLRVEDEAGNVVTDLTASLRFDVTAPPRVGNLLLNEFMADPNPVVGLPNAEYIELYNPTDTSVLLDGVGISSGGAPVVYRGDAALLPGAYVVLTDADAVADFTALNIPALGIDLPSLTNSGDQIGLHFFGILLQEINYTDGWYNDPERDEGGFSIEYIGGADAGCRASWRASLDPAGGTPGRENSVLGMSTDGTAPAIAEVEVSSLGITLTFDEVIDPAQFSSGLFSVTPALTVGTLAFPDGRTVFLPAEVEDNQLYTLTILPDFSDCAGNFPAEAIVLSLAIPTQPVPGDVVINEILFNPVSGGSDFVELYNCSEKVFQVNGWQLSNTTSTSSSGTRTVALNRLFLPGEYLTFTPDREDILRDFMEVNTALLLEQGLPTLGDDDGNVTVSVGGVVLDAFDYNEDFHSPLLSPNDGVSLERLRQKSATQDAANWYSAASAENFGTPTRANSQRRLGAPESTGDDRFALLNAAFSPDGDGFEDILEISYSMPGAGFLARIHIFDAQGRLVKTLRRVELLGAEGTLRWDGDNDEGRKAKAGLYVLYVESFSPDGAVREEKLVGVLAGRR